MAVLVDPHVPPVCFIVEVREQVIGNVNGLHVLHIDAAQGFIVLHTGIKLEAIQVLCEVDQVSHTGSMFAAVNNRLKFFQVALIQLGEQAGQMVEFVQVLILCEIVIEPKHITVKAGDEKFLVPHPVHADAF